MYNKLPPAEMYGYQTRPLAPLWCYLFSNPKVTLHSPGVWLLAMLFRFRYRPVLRKSDPIAQVFVTRWITGCLKWGLKGFRRSVPA